MDPGRRPMDHAAGGPGDVPVADDAGDGRPRWDPMPGAPLVPGLLAWDLLAVGHHRETWLCWSVDLWAPAVVKIVRPRWRSQWTVALDREVRALRALAHPAVPRLLGDGRDSCRPHIVVEYLDGQSLAQSVAEDGRFLPSDTARLGVLVLGAVRALHATGNAHLDVSPGNVLLVDRRPRLVDLGASRPLGSRLERGELLGTDGFIAPELAGAPGAEVTTAMDVYSVGAVLSSVLDPAGPGADRVAARLATLTEPDPRLRVGIDLAMSALIRCAGRGGSRPWPPWGDRYLPPPPRRYRVRPASLDGLASSVEPGRNGPKGPAPRAPAPAR